VTSTSSSPSSEPAGSRVAASPCSASTTSSLRAPSCRGAGPTTYDKVHGVVHDHADDGRAGPNEINSKPGIDYREQGHARPPSTSITEEQRQLDKMAEITRRREIKLLIEKLQQSQPCKNLLRTYPTKKRIRICPQSNQISNKSGENLSPIPPQQDAAQKSPRK
jgi:hypothetical protein